MAHIDEHKVAAAVSALGQPLVEFLCARPLEQVAASSAASSVVEHIYSFLTSADGDTTDVNSMAEYLKYRLVEDRDGELIAILLHKAAGGLFELPDGGDELGCLLVEVAANCYPILLLPADPFYANFPGKRLPIQLSSTLHRLAAARRFNSVVMEDPELALVFKNHSEDSGYSTDMIYRSTGRGNSIQLWMLLELVFSGAWRSVSSGLEAPTLVDFCDRALSQWMLIRRLLLSKEKTSVPARFAFAGVRLAEPGPFQFGAFKLRAASFGDVDLVPAGLEGQLQTTTTDGQTVVIDYAGDVVAEVDMPYLLRFREEPSDGSIPDWPADLRQMNVAADLASRLRISLLLAMDKGQRVHIVPSWSFMDDPLDLFAGVSWSDPRQAVGLLPTILSGEDVQNWQRWFGHATSPGADKVAIAMNRVIRATAERRDPVDTLIDAVIAWENMFGSSQGEPTLRVTASMAILLEADPVKRLLLREELAKIYTLRSKAVHGSSQPKESEIPLCYKAVDYAISALRLLLAKRPDLLTFPDGAGRSLSLIMNSSPAVED